MKRFFKDFLLTLAPLAFGVSLMWLAPVVALQLGVPDVAPAMVLSGFALFGLGLSHPLRRILFPYVDLAKIAKRADDSPTGSGLVFLGVSLVLASLLMTLGSSAKAAGLPGQARTYLPVLISEQQAWWPAMPAPAVLAAQVEAESRWNPRAELKTARERGVGLGQITITPRFDALAELRGQFPRALAGWAWDQSIYDPRLQLRGLVLMDLRNWRAIGGASDDESRMAMMLAAYNGGLGGLSADRALCSGTPGCDRGQWFGHVEHTSKKSRQAVGGYGRSFFAINRGYVVRIMTERRPVYEQAIGA